MNKLFKTYILLTISAITFANCTKEEKSIGYGNIRLSIGRDASLLVKGSLTAAPDTFVIHTTDTENSTVSELSGEYGMFKDAETVIPIGDYTISAYNITEEEAEEGRGKQRFFGSSTSTIEAGCASVVSFSCTMANAKVSFTFDDTFKEVYDIANSENQAKITVSTAANPTRIIEYNKDATLAEDDSQIAYFNVDDTNATLNFTITARRKSDSADKTFTNSFTIEPQSWYKVTIKAASTSGSDNISINMNAALPVDAASDCSI